MHNYLLLVEWKHLLSDATIVTRSLGTLIEKLASSHIRYDFGLDPTLRRQSRVIRVQSMFREETWVDTWCLWTVDASSRLVSHASSYLSHVCLFLLYLCVRIEICACVNVVVCHVACMLLSTSFCLHCDRIIVCAMCIHIWFLPTRCVYVYMAS